MSQPLGITGKLNRPGGTERGVMQRRPSVFGRYAGLSNTR
jgi:hypothetical protein